MVVRVFGGKASWNSQDFIMLCRRLKHALTASEARLEDLHKDVEVGTGS